MATILPNILNLIPSSFELELTFTCIEKRLWILNRRLLKFIGINFSMTFGMGLTEYKKKRTFQEDTRTNRRAGIR